MDMWRSRHFVVYGPKPRRRYWPYIVIPILTLLLAATVVTAVDPKLDKLLTLYVETLKAIVQLHAETLKAIVDLFARAVERL